MTKLSEDAKGLIDRPNFAHLATLLPDGAPQSTPVWIGREGERLVICTSDGSLKGRNTQRDPRVALSIVDFDSPYEEVQIRGRVVERRPDPELKTDREAFPYARFRGACGADHRCGEGAVYEASVPAHAAEIGPASRGGSL